MGYNIAALPSPEDKFIESAQRAVRKAEFEKSLRFIQKCRLDFGLFDSSWLYRPFVLPFSNPEERSFCIEWISAVHKMGYIVFEPHSALYDQDYHQTVPCSSHQQMLKTAGSLWMYLHLNEQYEILNHFEAQGVNTTPLLFDIKTQSYRHPVQVAISNGNLLQLERWLTQGKLNENSLVHLNFEHSLQTHGQDVHVKSLAHFLCHMPVFQLELLSKKFGPTPARFEQFVYGGSIIAQRNNKGMNALHMAAHLSRWDVLERMLLVLLHKEDQSFVPTLLQATDAKQQTLHTVIQKRIKLVGVPADATHYNRCMQYLNAIQEQHALAVEIAKNSTQALPVRKARML